MCDEVELLDANPKTALVCFPDGRESTVSVSDLAPLSDMSDDEPCDVPETTTENRTPDTETVQSETGQNGHAGMTLPRRIKRLISTINLCRVFGGRLELVGPLIVLEIMCLINVFFVPSLTFVVPNSKLSGEDCGECMI